MTLGHSVRVQHHHDENGPALSDDWDGHVDHRPRINLDIILPYLAA